jgi:hypothetical protein
MRRPDPVVPSGCSIVPYDRRRHRSEVRRVRAAVFEEDPWSESSEGFDEFDGEGILVAVDDSTGTPVRFVICSPARRLRLCVCVVAVVPGFRRRRKAAGLVCTAAVFLRSLGLDTIRIDAYEDGRCHA